MNKHIITIISLLLCCLITTSFAHTSFNFRVTGLHDPHLTNVQNYLKAHMPPEVDLTDTIIQQHFHMMADQIQDAMKPYGFFNSTINAKLSHHNGAWLAEFHVQRGAPVRIKKIDINISGPGQYNHQIQDFLHTLTLAPGKKINTIKYETFKHDLFELALELGYMRAHIVKSEIQIDPQARSAWVTFHFDTGPRYHFGAIHFSDVPLRETLLVRFLNFHEDDYYSPSQALALQQNLILSNYFSTVSVKPLPPDDATLSVSIDIELELRKPRTYTLGAGFGTDTGPRATIGLQINPFNDRGHKLISNAKISPKNGAVNFHYIIPGEHPVTDEYSINLQAKNSSLGKGEHKTIKFGVSKLSTVRDWQRTFSVDFQQERSRKSKADDFQTAGMLIPSASWSRRVVNDPVHPTDGYRVNFDVRGAAEPLASKTSFLQAKIATKYLMSHAKHNRFILHGEFGLTGTESFDDMSLSLLFRTGGSQSVRGYAYNSIGPGKYLVVGSAEYQFNVYGDWYLSAFYDVGNATNSLSERLRRSPGVGLVWLSPLGQVELSLARGLDSSNKPYVVQFNMGPEL